MLLPHLVAAQNATSTATASNTTAAALPAVYPGAGAYTYAGCYNETTNVASSGGLRALAGGTMEADDAMTPSLCFSFCGSAQYAGLEYGRECWCAPYLSSLAARLDDQECDLPCKGNVSAACGGALRLSLYNRTAAGSSGKKSEAGGVLRSHFRVLLGVMAVGAAVVAGL